jgi:hypothetical protein
MRDARSCRRLVWNHNYLPKSEEEELIRTAIVDRDLRTVDEVASFVGEALFERDTRETCPMGGLGVIRHWYVTDIERLLKRLEGIAVDTVPSR